MDYIKDKIKEKMLAEGIHDMMQSAIVTTTKDLWDRYASHYSDNNTNMVSVIHKTLKDRYSKKSREYGEEHAEAAREHAELCNDINFGYHHQEVAKIRKQHLKGKENDVTNTDTRSMTHKIASGIGRGLLALIGSPNGKSKNRESILRGIK